ncbi:hypothetical protein F2P56_020209 [Juglans regia]|uniref:Uncharacterized protein n=1 Tax=Juglans regia TaxID=51240 RepID=A0A833X5U3_JUGRE|nr:hypothetical protein F2P56_020209 [Juglans regia]
MPKLNPDYLSWQKTNQMILSILFSSLADSVIGHVITAGTSRELWLKLESMFSSHSQAKEFQVRFQLTNLSKGEQSVSDFFSKVRMLDDAIAATGNPLPDKEFVTYLLNGLGPLYESFVTSITTRTEPITSNELYHLLLVHESRMTHVSRNTSSLTSLEPSVNLSIGQSRNQRGIGSYRGNRFSRGHNRDFYRGRFSPSQSRPFQNNNSQSTFPPLPTYQICSKTGHTTLQCYSRFDHAYQYEQPHSFSTPPSANYTSPSAITDSSWYPDSVAIHHITHDLSHLNLSSEPYTRNDQIRVGNGSGLPIENIGDSSLLSNFSSFHLSKLLHDKITGKLLINGPIREGLYQFPPPRAPFLENEPPSVNGTDTLDIPPLIWFSESCDPTVCRISH